MRMRMTRAAVAVASVLGVLVLLSQQASAQNAPFPRFARFYGAWMARAMDQCVPSGVSVVGGPTLPGVGCLQSNVATDDTITLKYARLIVNRRGRIGLVAVGLPFAARVKVELALRVTKSSVQVKHPPGSFKRVTFEDITIQCPTGPFGFVAGPRGGIAATDTLANCLGASLSSLANPSANIEILDAALINVDTGKAFAKPGMVR